MACVCGDEAEVWIYQGALPQLGKRQPSLRYLCAGESIYGAQEVVVPSAVVSLLKGRGTPFARYRVSALKSVLVQTFPN